MVITNCNIKRPVNNLITKSLKDYISISKKENKKGTKTVIILNKTYNTSMNIICR